MRLSAHLIALLVSICLIVSGCRRDQAAPDMPAPAAKLVPDQEVLLKLECFDPIYKLDADGRVTRLRLTGRALPTDIVAEIGKLTELHDLDLYGAHVTDDALARLKDLQKLRTLGLGGTPITDKALPHVAVLTALQRVWVPTKTTSKAAIENLKKKRPDLNVYLQ
ncbi:MAG TPA: hypothetical protein VFE62_17280 [Gemmataceae bacterium]|nr:hypothetical protein [Gemmataceae bacterium]